MESHAKYTLVGTVVMTLIAAVAGLLWWLSDSHGDAEYDNYIIYFKRFSLSGMQPNGSVTMRGIKVGNVENLKIASDDIEAIKVMIKVNRGTPIKQNTRATVERNLLTGLASIDLIGSTESAKYLVAAAGQEYPVIPEGNAPLVELAHDLPELMQRIAVAVDRINIFLTPENAQSVKQTLANLDSITSTVAGDSGGLKKLVKDLNDLAVQTQLFLKEFESNVQVITAAGARTLDSVTLQVNKTGQAITSTAETVTSTVRNYEDPRVLFSQPGSDYYGPGERAK